MLKCINYHRIVMLSVSSNIKQQVSKYSYLAARLLAGRWPEPIYDVNVDQLVAFVNPIAFKLRILAPFLLILIRVVVFHNQASGSYPKYERLSAFLEGVKANPEHPNATANPLKHPIALYSDSCLTLNSKLIDADAFKKAVPMITEIERIQVNSAPGQTRSWLGKHSNGVLVVSEPHKHALNFYRKRVYAPMYCMVKYQAGATNAWRVYAKCTPSVTKALTACFNDRVFQVGPYIIVLILFWAIPIALLNLPACFSLLSIFLIEVTVWEWLIQVGYNTSATSDMGYLGAAGLFFFTVSFMIGMMKVAADRSFNIRLPEISLAQELEIVKALDVMANEMLDISIVAGSYEIEKLALSEWTDIARGNIHIAEADVTIYGVKMVSLHHAGVFLDHFREALRVANMELIKRANSRIEKKQAEVVAKERIARLRKAEAIESQKLWEREYGDISVPVMLAKMLNQLMFGQKKD